MKKIFDFIKNIFKRNKFELSFDKSINREDFEESMDNSVDDVITNLINTKSTFKMDFGIIDYNISKFENREIYNRMKMENKPEVFYEIETKSYRRYNVYDKIANISVVFMGVDLELWKLDLNAYIKYIGFSNITDEESIEIFVSILDSFLKYKSLHNMNDLNKPFDKLDLYPENEKINSIHFDSHIRSYGNYYYFNTFNPRHYSSVIKSNEIIEFNVSNENLFKYINQSLWEEYINPRKNYNYDDDLTIGIIRKEKI